VKTCSSFVNEYQYGGFVAVTEGEFLNCWY
jgi:hypothetical protein